MHKAIELLRAIPRGKVTTYAELARAAGTSPRAVGSLMRSNKDSVAYPCYKVVGSDGSLVGYSGPGGLRAKREMLERDGVEFRGEKVDLSAALFRF